MTKRIVPVAVGVALLVLLAWGVTSVLERLTRATVTTAPATNVPPPAESPHIAATLFYVTPEGDSLAPVKREVPLAEGIVAQARQILAAQLEPPPSPYMSGLPNGTSLRAFYLSEKGDAFVDLGGISNGHPGGSLAELLTVHTIVNAVTANLPAVQRVQILVDGKEVDTVAGHVDIRRPLSRDTSLVREASPAAQ